MSQDSWGTPLEVFEELAAEFCFTLDAAASSSNHLCENYLTEADDALTCSWRPPGVFWGAVWCNPPYSKEAGGLEAWVRKGHAEAKAHRITVVMLVPPSMGTRYMAFAYRHAAEIRFFDGRLAFRHPETGQPVRGNRYDSCLIVFRGARDVDAPAQCCYVSRPPNGSARPQSPDPSAEAPSPA